MQCKCMDGRTDRIILFMVKKNKHWMLLLLQRGKRGGRSVGAGKSRNNLVCDTVFGFQRFLALYFHVFHAVNKCVNFVFLVCFRSCCVV